MKEAFKIFSWLFLILTWLVVVVGLFIFDHTGMAVGMGIVAIFTLVGWGMFLSWMFGLRRKLQHHLRLSAHRATFLEKEVPASRVADIRRALENLFHDKSTEGNRRYGVNFVYGQTLSSLQHEHCEIRRLNWTSFEAQEGRYENLPSNAVYFLRHEGRPFAVHLYVQNDSPFAAGYDDIDTVAPSKGEQLQVYAATIDDASRAISYVLREASVGSVYRGKMLHVAVRNSDARGKTIRVSDRPQIEMDRIVLPPDVFDVITRAVEIRLRHHSLLERYGHSSKTGILLHGAPGTGKTLLCKHLIGVCHNYTAIVPVGMDAESIREVFRLASYLQPAMIVIEDVDLLAERRETNANVTGLQDLMNEMDGLLPSTEAIVVMTTNRPDVLEPALASRPGRVSQTIEFPLPDDELRERLLRMFCSTADYSQVDFSQWVGRTPGASPAFLEELTKKALLFAALRQPEHLSEPLALADQDFDRAMHELVVFGGTLTGNLLGFPASSS